MRLLISFVISALAYAQYGPPSGGGAPTGAAGGDLTGTYPNPGVVKLNGVAASSYAQAGSAPWFCAPASASGAAYTCTPTLLDGTAIASSLLSAPANGQQLIFVPDVQNTGSFTIQIDGANARGARWLLTGVQVTFSANDLNILQPYLFLWRSAATRWVISPGQSTAPDGTSLAASGGFSRTFSLATNPAMVGHISQIDNTATVGKGTPAIYGTGRATAQVAAAASVATFTVGASDGSFIVSANVLVTASTTHNFTTTLSYTDEGNTARTLTLTFSQVTGVFLTAITNVQGIGAYEGVPLHIRCKAATAITIQTTGTFTSVTYNVEGFITQIG